MKECFFCKYIKQSDLVLENDLAFARFDDYPINKGHLEVITKRHTESWWDTTIEERLAIFELLDKAKKLVDGKYNPIGYNIGINIGEAARQSVMHLHVHLIPRYKKDVLNPRGGVRNIIPDKLLGY